MRACTARRAVARPGAPTLTTMLALVGLVLPFAESTAPPCEWSPLHGSPVCDTTRDAAARATSLAKLLTILEKATLMSTGGAGGNAGHGIPRLGVPGFPTGEGLHGVATGCAADPSRPSTGACPTSFPHATALAASFSREEWRGVGSVISLEARALHNTEVAAGLALFAPDINLFRDPRWGRGQETPGEDPALTSEYAMNFISGLQKRDASGVLRALSTPKHAFDYDVEGNRGRIDRGSVNNRVSKQDQSRYYWPQWRAAAQGAKAQAVMCSYPAVGGVPSCGNQKFLDGILRGSFKFNGLVVTDCGAIEDAAFFAYIEKQAAAGTNASLALQAAVALKAGVNLNCGGWYARWLPTAVEEGLVSEKELDDSFATLWKLAFELGLFDRSTYDALNATDVDTAEARQLALATAVHSQVLLKNDNRTLPLVDPARSNKKVRVALLGPHFNSSKEMLSNYATGSNNYIYENTPLVALSRRNATMEITTALAGCRFDGRNTSRFAAAERAAAEVDSVVLMLGLHAGRPGESAEGEDWDREHLLLSYVQEELLKTVASAAKSPIILVIMSGGTIDVSWALDSPKVGAILQSWYPGQAGGEAIARILTGEDAPSGRLPVAIYDNEKFLARRPEIAEMSMTVGGGITDGYDTVPAVRPFGFGLSFTNFELSMLSPHGSKPVTMTTLDIAAAYEAYYVSGGKTSALQVSLRVRNIGGTSSELSVLAFVLPISGGADAPIRALGGFERLPVIPAKGSEEVTIAVSATAFAMTDLNGTMAIRPGEYELRVGESRVPFRSPSTSLSPVLLPRCLNGRMACRAQEVPLSSPHPLPQHPLPRQPRRLKVLARHRRLRCRSCRAARCSGRERAILKPRRLSQTLIGTGSSRWRQTPPTPTILTIPACVSTPA
jgi:beta-glucosidase-like glycosyl hydrolase